MIRSKVPYARVLRVRKIKLPRQADILCTSRMFHYVQHDAVLMLMSGGKQLLPTRTLYL